MHKLSVEGNDGDDGAYPNERSFEDWKTPEFIQIKQKPTKRLSQYSENDVWERDEILTLLKYEQYKRNKSIISLMWYLDARPHEITLLKIKHIRLRKNYGEGEISLTGKNRLWRNIANVLISLCLSLAK